MSSGKNANNSNVGVPERYLYNSFVCVTLQYFIEYNAHFYTLKMVLKYFLRTIHGR